mgnify:CR=1
MTRPTFQLLPIQKKNLKLSKPRKGKREREREEIERVRYWENMSSGRSSLDRAVSMFKTLRASDTSSSSLIDASNLLFFVNGRRETIPSSSVDTRMTLLQYLRQSGRTG